MANEKNLLVDCVFLCILCETICLLAAVRLKKNQPFI